MLALFSNRSYVIHLLLVTAATLTLGLVSTIHAQETTYDASFSTNVKEAIPINVLVGQSRVINFDRPIGRFSISNPEIAEAVMVRPDQVLVNGKGFGQVNFIAWEKSDSKFIVFDVFVRANLSLIDSRFEHCFRVTIFVSARPTARSCFPARLPIQRRRPRLIAWSRLLVSRP